MSVCNVCVLCVLCVVCVVCVRGLQIPPGNWYCPVCEQDPEGAKDRRPVTLGDLASPRSRRIHRMANVHNLRSQGPGSGFADGTPAHADGAGPGHRSHHSSDKGKKKHKKLGDRLDGHRRDDTGSGKSKKKWKPFAKDGSGGGGGIGTPGSGVSGDRDRDRDDLRSPRARRGSPHGLGTLFQDSPVTFVCASTELAARRLAALARCGVHTQHDMCGGSGGGGVDFEGGVDSPMGTVLTPELPTSRPVHTGGGDGSAAPVGGGSGDGSGGAGAAASASAAGAGAGASAAGATTAGATTAGATAAGANAASSSGKFVSSGGGGVFGQGASGFPRSSSTPPSQFTFDDVGGHGSPLSFMNPPIIRSLDTRAVERCLRDISLLADGTLPSMKHLNAVVARGSQSQQQRVLAYVPAMCLWACLLVCACVGVFVHAPRMQAQPTVCCVVWC